MKNENSNLPKRIDDAYGIENNEIEKDLNSLQDSIVENKIDSLGGNYINPEHVIIARDFLANQLDDQSGKFGLLLQEIINGLNTNVSPDNLTTKKSIQQLIKMILKDDAIDLFSRDPKDGASSEETLNKIKEERSLNNKSYKEKVIREALITLPQVQKASFHYISKPFIEYLGSYKELRQKLNANLQLAQPKDMRDILTRNELSMLSEWKKSNPVLDYSNRVDGLKKQLGIKNEDFFTLMSLWHPVDFSTKGIAENEGRRGENLFDSLHIMFKAYITDPVLFSSKSTFEQRKADFQEAGIDVGGLQALTYGARTPFAGVDVTTRDVNDMINKFSTLPQ